MSGRLYSSKKPYGNKTHVIILIQALRLYSSKKPYGNKTGIALDFSGQRLYSSKKPYGNKTDTVNDASLSGYILAKNHMVTKHGT